MQNLRHLLFFLSLGAIWGVSPSFNKYMATIHMPIAHTLVITGLGVGLLLWVLARVQTGTWHISWAIHRYGAICAFLMNLPFALHLYLARHLPPTELAIMITTSSFFSYFVAWLTGWETTNWRKLTAILIGFLSTVILILSREDALNGNISIWLIVGFGIPVLYSIYNIYAAKASPKDANVLHVATTESIWSGLLALPLLILAAPFDGTALPVAMGYWMLAALVVAWLFERYAFFTLIRERGAVYTGQATYVATPTAVIIAVIFFGGGNDVWLWISLALLMLALFLNNSRAKATSEQRTG